MRCYKDSLEHTVSSTNLRKFFQELYAVAELKYGEVVGMEVLWVPVDKRDNGITLKHTAESYPALWLY